jgi:glycosyltransferase involved in cell wall biosynthesis
MFLHDSALVCVTLAEALARKGHSSTLVLPEIFRAIGISSVASLKVKYADTYKLMSTSLAVASDPSFDVVVSSNPTSWVLGAALRTLRLRGHAVILHGSDIRKAGGPGPRKLISLLALRKSDVVFCTTPDLVDAGKRFGIEVTYLPVPIDTKRFARRDTQFSNDERPLIFSPTRLDSSKGASIILKLIGMLAARFPRARIVQIAYFEEGDDSYLDWLRKNIACKANNVSLIPIVNYFEMPSLIRQADLVIGQFKLGVAGAIEFQAMSCGVPVVFFDRWHGYGITEPSAETAFDFSVSVITEPENRSALVRKGLELVHMHDSDRVAMQFMSRVESLA